MRKSSLLLLVVLVLAASVCWAAVDKAQVSEPNAVVESGPTLKLDYNDGKIDNPIFSFMYFVPLISPTLVQSEISPENSLRVKFASYKIEKDEDSFEVEYKFDINGEGTYNNIFYSEQIINWNTKYNDHNTKGDKLTKLLEYIKFEGQGHGRCDIKGSIDKGQMVVDQMRVHFNDGDSASPVLIGIYDIAPDANANYDFDKRFNKIAARVNTLTFKRDKKGQSELPRMEIKIACISNDADDCQGFWASLKGKLANLIIKPITISRIGNDSMIDFGLAITEQKSSFTFPLAENLLGGAPVVASISKMDEKTTIDD